MQQQLNEQQQQINRLQGELKEARGQVKLVNSGSQPELVPIGYSEPSGEPAAAVAVAPGAPPPGPSVVPAIVPVRVFPVDPPKTGGLIPAIKLGPVSMTPYGFIKATAVRDTSAPDGDDFPFVGLFLNASNALTTGVTQDASFHVKARSTRFGANFEWPDISKNLTLTGRIEADFEGNFNESDNRDISSIRNPTPNLRLAYVRLDYHASDNTDIYFLGGQDWTLFGSGVIPNVLETTFNDAFYGAVYTRSPQLRGGWMQKLSQYRNLKLLTEFGIMMPSSGQIEKLGVFDFEPGSTNLVAPFDGGEGLAVQLGQGEREGADSGRPELEGRVTLQFQLDNARGVAPAQISLSGFYGWRQYIPIGDFEIDGGALNTADVLAIQANPLRSKMYGGQFGVQLPTRWFTATASLYRGGDMRFYFGGQLNAFATSFCPAAFPVAHFLQTQDGSPAATGPAVVCQNEAGTAGITSPERPIRAFGGFVQVGFPLSRLFNANPEGHNAGWQLYFMAGKDQVVSRDLFKFSGIGTTAAQDLLAQGAGGLPLSMGKTAAVTLFYKLNQWAQFGFEQSIYATRFANHIPGYGIGAKAYLPPFIGSNEWQDHRTEFGPIFTF